MSDSSHSDGIDVAKMRKIIDFFTGEFEMKRTTVEVDIAKNVFVRPASRLNFCFTGEGMT